MENDTKEEQRWGMERIACHSLWLEFLEYKTDKMLLSKKEEEQLRDYIQNKRYLPMAEKILQGNFHFSIPEKRELNKMGSTKKRIVYRFKEEENILLKMISWLLYEYDDCISDNCYSFRKNTGARKAFLAMANNREIENLHGFKADISNYFNSIDISLLLPMLQQVLANNPLLFEILKDLLLDDRAIWQGEIISEKRGVMAGTPTSPFLANLYLREMDQYFEAQNIFYARYSDDILIFAPEKLLMTQVEEYGNFLKKYKLTSNPEKEEYFTPGEKWHFLGFEYQNGIVDISPVATRKLMNKIRRYAKSLRRWSLRKKISPEQSLRIFNRKFNKKFYDKQSGRQLCWSRWYFPMINTDRTLYVIDKYMQDWQRYVVTGKHNKANYRKVSYEILKSCGYRPLVSAYYESSPWRKD